MNPTQRIKMAYTLLPPPLSSTPAKYWTSISLWLHSYIVGSTFQELVDALAGPGDIEAPEPDEAFLIGFLHDLGQKMGLMGERSSEKIRSWLIERLEQATGDPRMARSLVKYVYTNPAETRTDITYPAEVWWLLWLADRLQGLENIYDIIPLLSSIRREVKIDLKLLMVNIAIPQPFLRTLISASLYKYLHRQAVESEETMIPLATPYGAAILTTNPDLRVILDWDQDIRPGYDGNGLIPEAVEENLYWNSECCKNPECRERCSGRSKPEDCKRHGYKKRDCEKGVYPGEKGNSYKIALIYYGLRHRPPGDVVLPGKIRSMLQGVELIGVRYVDGGRVQCPICGLKTPVAVPVDFLQTFYRDLTTEQWNRRIYPGSVNVLMQDVRHYGVDPLCLGDVLARSRLENRILVSLALRAPAPFTVLEDIGYIMWRIMTTASKERVTRNPTAVYEFMYNGDDWDSRLNEVIGSGSTTGAKYFYDGFTATVYLGLRGPYRKHIDEWIHDMAMSGLLALWGFYPLAVSESPPDSPHDKLLVYYKGRRPLYDYRPADKSKGAYTPYVAAVMASMGVLAARRANEQLPAFLEVLDYPPEYSPLLLEYSSPRVYSILESLRDRIGGGA